MEKFFLLTKKSLGFFFVSLFFSSCDKIEVLDPVATVPVSSVVPPVVVIPNYSISATAENGKISPETTTVEKGGSVTLKFEPKNSLYEATSIISNGFSKTLNPTDDVFVVSNILEDRKVTVKYSLKEVARLLIGKNWDYHFFQIEKNKPIPTNELEKLYGRMNFEANATRNGNPDYIWGFGTKVKPNDFLVFAYKGSVYEQEIIELTNSKLVLSAFIHDISIGKNVEVFRTYYAK